MGLVMDEYSGGDMVPGANVTVYDTMTLSVGMGWQVEAAARMAAAGWPLDKTIETLKKVREVTELLYTLPELKYLIHGGRISHIKGLLAQVLKIKPIIGVSKEDGKYYQKSQNNAHDLRLGDHLIGSTQDTDDASCQLELYFV